MKKLTLLILTPILLISCSTPQNIVVNIEAPTQAVIGEPFEIVITVENQSESSQTIQSIDIGNKYLEGILLSESNPAFTESWDFPAFGFMSFDYKTEIPASESTQVALTMEAILAGDYSASFDVCINTEANCIYNVVRTVVSDATEVVPEE